MLLTAGLAVVLSGSAAQAAPVTVTFDQPGAYTWTVPGGVTSVAVTLAGGEGGPGGGQGLPWGAGGRGATVTGTIAVTPGQVLSLEVRSGVIAAQVQGSRRTPYLVTISLAEPTPAQWAAIDAAMAAKVGFVARLLAGEVPPDLEDAFLTAGVPLFPSGYAQLRAHCSCPDSANPCKHLAAVLYVFADQLDADPWLVLAWRGRSRDDLLGYVSRDDGAAVAPWWPFAPGPLPDLPARPVGEAVAPEDAAEVLDALEPLAVAIGSVPFVELLRPAYEALVDGSEMPPVVS